MTLRGGYKQIAISQENYTALTNLMQPGIESFNAVVRLLLAKWEFSNLTEDELIVKATEFREQV